MPTDCTLDYTKTNIFIWVPGTGGDEVHPAFRKAAEKATGGDCHFICVDYPASIDFIVSATRGMRELKRVLKIVAKQVKEGQRVFLGGSSQGSWVIGDTLYKDIELLDGLTKVVMFGDPGISQSPKFNFFYEEKIWEIDNPNDAVTFGWDEKDKEEITKALKGLYRFKPKSILTLLKYTFTRPALLFRLMTLTALHTKLFTWVNSPHDYSPQMPLAVYWLLH